MFMRITWGRVAPGRWNEFETVFKNSLTRPLPKGMKSRWLVRDKKDRDVGYIFGAVFEGEYRGLQFSYDDDHAELGIGGLLQYHQIIELCVEGVARYDLGTEMDYKRRWAEDVMETEMLVVVR